MCVSICLFDAAGAASFTAGGSHYTIMLLRRSMSLRPCEKGNILENM